MNWKSSPTKRMIFAIMIDHPPEERVWRAWVEPQREWSSRPRCSRDGKATRQNGHYHYDHDYYHYYHYDHDCDCDCDCEDDDNFVYRHKNNDV